MDIETTKISTVLKNVVGVLLVFLAWVGINYGLCWLVRVSHAFTLPVIMSMIVSLTALHLVLPDQEYSGKTGNISALLLMLYGIAGVILSLLVLYLRANTDLGLQDSIGARGQFLFIYGSFLAIIMIIMFTGYKEKKLNPVTATFCPILQWLPIAVMATMS